MRWWWWWWGFRFGVSGLWVVGQGFRSMALWVGDGFWSGGYLSLFVGGIVGQGYLSLFVDGLVGLGFWVGDWLR